MGLRIQNGELSLPGVPSSMGLRRARRLSFWPDPALNELVGVRVGLFLSAGGEKVLLGGWLEMLLG